MVVPFARHVSEQSTGYPDGFRFWTVIAAVSGFVVMLLFAAPPSTTGITSKKKAAPTRGGQMLDVNSLTFRRRRERSLPSSSPRHYEAPPATAARLRAGLHTAGRAE